MRMVCPAQLADEMACARSFALGETSTHRPHNITGAGCVSRTRMFRFTKAALYLVQPSRQINKWSAAALRKTDATLQQGLPLRAERGAAGQFWTFTMSNSKTWCLGFVRVCFGHALPFAETTRFDAADRMHVDFARSASALRVNNRRTRKGASKADAARARTAKP